MTRKALVRSLLEWCSGTLACPYIWMVLHPVALVIDEGVYSATLAIKVVLVPSLSRFHAAALAVYV